MLAGQGLLPPEVCGCPRAPSPCPSPSCHPEHLSLSLHSKGGKARALAEAETWLGRVSPSSFGHCVPAPSHSVGVPRGGAVYAGFRKIPGPPPRLQVRGGKGPWGQETMPAPTSTPSEHWLSGVSPQERPSERGREKHGGWAGESRPHEGERPKPRPLQPRDRALWGAGAPARAAPTSASAGAEGWMGPPL